MKRKVRPRQLGAELLVLSKMAEIDGPKTVLHDDLDGDAPGCQLVEVKLAERLGDVAVPVRVRVLPFVACGVS